ncbi:MAG: hypothetical protein WA609_17285 [Terriglobales bacterium]
MHNPWKEIQKLKQLVEVQKRNIDQLTYAVGLQDKIVESLRAVAGLEASMASRVLDERLAEIDRTFLEAIGIDVRQYKHWRPNETGPAS